MITDLSHIWHFVKIFTGAGFEDFCCGGIDSVGGGEGALGSGGDGDGSLGSGGVGEGRRERVSVFIFWSW